LDSPTQSPSYLERFDLTRLSLPVKKLRELQTLAIVSWYCPDEVRLLIQLELESTWLTRNPDDAKEILLTSKDLALCWLLTMSKWNESDFYGNNLTKSFVQKFSLIDFRRRPTSHVDRYTGYCRGYQDAHRGAPSSLGTEHWARTSVAEDLWQQFLSEVKRSLLFQQCSRTYCTCT
jgi:hypothetical protein